MEDQQPPAPPEGGNSQRPALEGELLPREVPPPGGFANAELPSAIRDLMTSNPRALGGPVIARLLLAEATQLAAINAELRKEVADVRGKLDTTNSAHADARVRISNLEGQLAMAKGDRKMEKHLLFIGALLFGAGFKYMDTGVLAVSAMVAGAGLCVIAYLGFGSMRKSQS